MVSLNLEQTCILELIKASLFDLTPEIPENVNWDKLLELAKAQCIVPLVVSFVPSENRKEWNTASYHSRAHYMQILYEQKALVNLLKANSIPFIIFKGTAAAVYFPVSSLRSYGDIDLFVPGEYFDSAKTVLEKNGYKYLDKNYRHYEYSKNGIEFELHRRISSKNYNYVENIFLNGLNNAVECIIGDSSFPCLPTFENGLVLLGHIMQHLKGSGIGLRQIIDWMMFVHKVLDDTTWEQNFKPLAVEAGLEKLAVTVTYLCKKWLGLPNEISWCDGADEEVADNILYLVFEDGDLGNERASYESVKVSFKNEGTFKYLQRAGVLNWPLAQKYAFFRPFAWLHQLCKYACQGIAGLFTGNKVFRKEKQVLPIEEIWKKLE